MWYGRWKLFVKYLTVNTEELLFDRKICLTQTELLQKTAVAVVSGKGEKNYHPVVPAPPPSWSSILWFIPTFTNNFSHPNFLLLLRRRHPHHQQQQHLILLWIYGQAGGRATWCDRTLEDKLEENYVLADMLSIHVKGVKKASRN